MLLDLRLYVLLDGCMDFGVKTSSRNVEFTGLNGTFSRDFGLY